MKTESFCENCDTPMIKKSEQHKYCSKCNGVVARRRQKIQRDTQRKLKEENYK